MAELAWPALFTVLVWWASTGVILYLNGLPRWTFRHTFALASLLMVAAFWGLTLTRDLPTVAGAYCAFSCAVLIWAWQEVAFLLGYVTGPRRVDCPAGCVGWRRVSYALQTVLHHEIVLLLLGILAWAIAGDGANRVGWYTFGILWVMRQSAKLNVFLGVRNLSESFLPPHLCYLQTYFTRRPMNALFPFSVTLPTILVIAVWQGAFAPLASSYEIAAFTLLATLLSLAILEHWFMVLPIPFERLWQWGMRSRRMAAASTTRPAEAP